MTNSTASRVIFTAVLSAAFVCLPGSAFAQHGGGGHGGGGGGFHGGGGGGFHGGGGAARSGGFSGGGRSFSAPSAPRGGGSYRPSAPSSAARPNGNFSHPTTGNYRPPTGNLAGGANAARDGQWHAFGPRTGVGPGGSPVFGGFGGGVGFRGGAGDRPGLGFGFPYQNRFRFGGFRGGFGPGWGWGGWGLGWGGLGLGWGLGFNSCWGFGWTWDPFCDGFAAWPAYPAYGYGGYGYPGGYPYPPSVNYDPNYSPDSTENYPQPSDSVTPTAPSLIEPNSGANLPGAAAQSQAAVVIYMKDGSSILPTDYWMTDDQFHYLLGGHEYIVPLSRVDLQKTNDVNHQNGATFRLKPEPDDPSAAPGPGASTTPAPDQPATL